MTKDIIIIGGGPAGLAAGIYATRAGLDVLLVEKMFVGGQIATANMLENYPGFAKGIGGVEFSMLLEEHAKKYGLNIVYETVKGFHLNGTVKRIITDSNEYQAKSIILAMGAEPRMLNIKGEREFRGRGVSYCATCDGSFYRKKTVAVIGGGDTACEEAEYLSNLCEKVYLVHRRDKLRAVGVVADRIQKIDNIEILWNAIPEQIVGGDAVEGIILRNKITNNLGKVDVSGVFIAIGTTPITMDIKDQIRLSDSGHIETDKYLSTNINGIFAAGDIRTTPLKQVVTACADGAIAAEAAREYINEL